MNPGPLMALLSASMNDGTEETPTTRPPLAAQRAFLLRAWEAVFSTHPFVDHRRPHPAGTLVCFKEPLDPLRKGVKERHALILWRYIDWNDAYTIEIFLKARGTAGMMFPDCAIAWMDDSGSHIQMIPYVANALRTLTPEEQSELALYREDGEEGGLQPQGESS